MRHRIIMDETATPRMCGCDSRFGGESMDASATA
jgi:hypothetical protein